MPHYANLKTLLKTKYIDIFKEQWPYIQNIYIFFKCESWGGREKEKLQFNFATKPQSFSENKRKMLTFL